MNHNINRASRQRRLGLGTMLALMLAAAAAFIGGIAAGSAQAATGGLEAGKPDSGTATVAGTKARLLANGTAVPPAGAPLEVKNVILAGNKIAKKPYKWGGGHGRWNDSGYDCSGSVSYALRGGKLLSSPLAGEFRSYGKSGKGEWITVYINSSHVYMTVAGLRYDTSAQRENGSRWSKAPRSWGSGFIARHPASL